MSCRIWNSIGSCRRIRPSRESSPKRSPLLVTYGLVEAECLDVADREHCEYAIEDMRSHRPKQWSSRKQLACRAEPGGFIELEMSVATAGRFNFEVGLTHGPRVRPGHRSASMEWRSGRSWTPTRQIAPMGSHRAGGRRAAPGFPPGSLYGRRQESSSDRLRHGDRLPSIVTRRDRFQRVNRPISRIRLRFFWVFRRRNTHSS